MKPQTNTSVESQRLLTATLIAGLIATALALLILSWLGREIVTGVTPEVDDAFRRMIHSHASPRITPIRYGRGPASSRSGRVSVATAALTA